ncbi:MAG: hybrid sensor histidine kinase/response regulator [Cyanobacteriota bacterium]|nr:hybrid sensor histidine kinase/response regulator [Cyanobacteriota bacterium]
MSLIDADIRDYAYQLFVEEAPELLRQIESTLLTLTQGLSSSDIHALMRATHSLKGNAASLGLESVQTLAHRLESAVKALQSETLVITPNLESSFLAASDCLSYLLTQGIQTGHYRLPPEAEAIFRELETQLAHVEVNEFALPTTSDYGIDLRQSIFEVDVSRSLSELAATIQQGDPTILGRLLRSQAQAFVDLGQMLDLPIWSDLSLAILQSLTDPSLSATGLAPLAHQAWQTLQTAILRGEDLPSLSTLTALLPSTPLNSPPSELADKPVPIPESELESDFDWGFPSNPTPLAAEEDFFQQLVESLPDLAPPATQTVSPIPPLLASGIPLPTAQPNKEEQGQPSLSIRIEQQRLDKIGAQVGELSISRNQMQRQQEWIRQLVEGLRWRLKGLRERSLRLERIGDQMISADSALALPVLPPLSPGNPVGKETSFDTLELDRYSNLNLLIQEVLEESAQVEETLDDLSLYVNQLEQTLRYHGKGVSELNEELMAARLLPILRVFERMPRLARDLARAQNKTVEIRLQGSEVLVDKLILDQIYTPLVHLVRNAIDHGIEPPSERQAESKPPVAQLSISAIRQGGQVLVQVKDDGRGIDPDRIRQQVLAQGLADSDDLKIKGDPAVLDWIFAPGFSTASQVSEISGRGVGLNAVRNHVQAIKGTVSVQSTPKRGTTFTLRLPLTLGLTQLILVRAGRSDYAFPIDTVVEILPVTVGIPTCVWRGRTLTLKPLLSLLHYGLAAQSLIIDAGLPAEQPSALIFERDGEVAAIVIDYLVAQQELIIKPLDSGLPTPDYFYGCTVGATGLLIPVLDGWTLAQQTSLLAPQQQASFPSAGLSDGKQHLMVIDDSVMMRQTLARQLERAGYRVSQAKDGQEALTQLASQPDVDLIFCDVEMPRMNGFELLAHRRKTPELADTPVVMLTSRSGQKHRRLAMQLGADAYLTKPCLEYELLAALNELLPKSQNGSPDTV